MIMGAVGSGCRILSRGLSVHLGRERHAGWTLGWGPGCSHAEVRAEWRWGLRLLAAAAGTDSRRERQLPREEGLKG